MSILDSITAAEASAAEQIRQAKAKALELVADAEDAAGKQAESKVKAAAKQAEEDILRAKRDAAGEARERLVGADAENAAAADKARANLKRAAAYIVERIEKR